MKSIYRSIIGFNRISLTCICLLSTSVLFSQSMPWGGSGEEYIVESDPIQGDWAGEWISGPTGKAAEIVAQVVARGNDSYMIRILNYFDKINSLNV